MGYDVFCVSQWQSFLGYLPSAPKLLAPLVKICFKEVGRGEGGWRQGGFMVVWGGRGVGWVDPHLGKVKKEFIQRET